MGDRAITKAPLAFIRFIEQLLQNWLIRYKERHISTAKRCLAESDFHNLESLYTEYLWVMLKDGDYRKRLCSQRLI
jgi:hypothetical protein